MKYHLNPDADLHIARGFSVSQQQVLEAINRTGETMERFREFDVDVFALLGMRNLSAFVGEVFGASLQKVCGHQFVKNPHQDGYPDLLLLDIDGAALWRALADRRREKEPFSPFRTGGIEIKATCGSTPSAQVLTKKGLSKPDIGETRIDLMNGYDWKAHHRDTNNLMGILWDFMDGHPFVAAVFYSNRLSEEHWGKIVQPKAGGGRTTSVSIMTRDGVRTMYSGWVACCADSRYADFLNRHNGDALIPRGPVR